MKRAEPLTHRWWLNTERDTSGMEVSPEEGGVPACAGKRSPTASDNPRGLPAHPGKPSRPRMKACAQARPLANTHQLSVERRQLGRPAGMRGERLSHAASAGRTAEAGAITARRGARHTCSP